MGAQSSGGGRLSRANVSVYALATPPGRMGRASGMKGLAVLACRDLVEIGNAGIDRDAVARGTRVPARIVCPYIIGIAQAAEHSTVDVAGTLDRLEAAYLAAIVGAVDVVAGYASRHRLRPEELYLTFFQRGDEAAAILPPARPFGAAVVEGRLPGVLGP